MQDAGWEVLCYFVKGSPMAEDATARGLQVHFIPRQRRYVPVNQARAFRQILQDAGIQKLIFRDSHDMSLLATTKSLMKNRLKVFYWQAMQIGVDKRSPVHTRRFSKLDAWIASLPFLVEEIQQRTRFPKERIHQIPLGLELKRFEQSISREEARQSFGISEAVPLLGIIGRIDPKKRQDLAVESLKLLHADYPAAKLLIVGDATRNESRNYEVQLKKLIRNLGLENHVVLHPFIPDSERFYAAVDFVLMASTAETFGTVTIEAMASGAVVVGSDAGGTPELLKQGELGYLFQSGNAASATQQLLHAIAHPEEARVKGVRARDVAHAEYSHLTILRRFEELLATGDR